MADIGTLPTPGQKPWTLTPAITAMNDELEGRLGASTLAAQIAGGSVPLRPAQAALDAAPATAISSVADIAAIGGRVDTVIGGNWRIGKYEITLPPGKFVITSPGAFMTGTASDGRRIRGFSIRGAGRYITEVVFDPSVSGYLFENNDVFSRLSISDLTFTGASANANFMNSVSNGGPQSMTFDRVVWRGTWGFGFNLTGNDTNSEFKWEKCTVLGTWNTFVYSDNVQVLNHDFISCDVEPNNGTMLNYNKGGNVNVIGGSWIGGKENSAATGSFIVLGSQSSMSTNRFMMEGVRIEYRSLAYQLINSAWGGGTITFKDVHDVGYQNNLANEPSATRAFFDTGGSSTAQYPVIKFENCRLFGKHEYYVRTQNDTLRQNIVYEDCIIQNFSVMSDFIITTLAAGVSTRFGARPPIRFTRCLSGSDPSSTKMVDMTVNGSTARNGTLHRHTVSMRTGFGILPDSAATTLALTLPLGAIITRVVAWARAGASSATDTAWKYTLRTSDSVNTIFAKGGADSGAGQNAGFFFQVEPYFLCDSSSRTQLILEANANTGQSGQSCRFLVEYLA